MTIAQIPPFGLSPVGWRWALLLGLLFREQNETQQPQGGQGDRFGLRGLGRGDGLNVLTTLTSRGEQNTALFFPPMLVFTTLYSTKWISELTKQGPNPRCRFWIAAPCVYICTYVYIYTTGVHLALAAVFSLVVKREIWLKVLL